MSYKLYLAPMEGVTDAPLRQILTKYGHYDSCTTEFIRVTDVAMPSKCLIREVPELEQGCVTKSNVTVRVQFLGDNKESLLQTALKAVDLGASYIDINFGCPSRFVHHSGSMLLKEPELLHDIVAYLLDGLAHKAKLSLKIRTGFEHKSECEQIIKAVALEGLDEIAIHCRTRKDLYQKEALDWSVVSKMQAFANGIPLVVNGDIVDLTSFEQARLQAQTERFMIGRGALMIPNMPQVIKGEEQPFNNDEIIKVAIDFFDLLASLNFMEKSILDRTKQFFGYARINNPSLAELFKLYCRYKDQHEAREFLEKCLARDLS